MEKVIVHLTEGEKQCYHCKSKLEGSYAWTKDNIWWNNMPKIYIKCTSTKET